MGFHSDSETGVQGTIASLSLGSPASMRFRPLKRRACKTACGNGAVVLQLELYHVCDWSHQPLLRLCGRMAYVCYRAILSLWMVLTSRGSMRCVVTLTMCFPLLIIFHQ